MLAGPEYLGCFKDDHNRVLKGDWIQEIDMTIEKCTDHCFEKVI